MKNKERMKIALATHGFLSHEIETIMNSSKLNELINSPEFFTMIDLRAKFISNRQQQGYALDTIIDTINKYYQKHVFDFIKQGCVIEDDATL